MLSPPAIQELIRRSQPRSRLAGARLPIYILSGVLVGILIAEPALLGLPAEASSVAPLLLVLWVVGLGRWELRRHLRQVRRWNQANEAVLLEEWQAALQTLRALLARPVDNAIIRVQGLLSLAAVTDHFGQYESSQVIYESLLNEQSAQPVQRQAAAVGLAAALLRNEALADAVSLIDRLARVAEDAPQPWKAQIELLCLFREAVMGQYDDILEATDRRRELFRECLSTRSGYGYALLALGHHRRGVSEVAGRLWHDATLLIRPEKLMHRFPVLSDMAGRYPACEAPI